MYWYIQYVDSKILFFLDQNLEILNFNLLMLA